MAIFAVVRQRIMCFIVTARTLESSTTINSAAPVLVVATGTGFIVMLVRLFKCALLYVVQRIWKIAIYPGKIDLTRIKINNKSSRLV